VWFLCFRGEGLSSFGCFLSRTKENESSATLKMDLLRVCAFGLACPCVGERGTLDASSLSPSSNALPRIIDKNQKMKKMFFSFFSR